MELLVSTELVSCGLRGRTRRVVSCGQGSHTTARDGELEKKGWANVGALTEEGGA